MHMGACCGLGQIEHTFGCLTSSAARQGTTALADADVDESGEAVDLEAVVSQVWPLNDVHKRGLCALQDPNHSRGVLRGKPGCHTPFQLPV
jgi:hypothetical protein